LITIRTEPWAGRVRGMQPQLPGNAATSPLNVLLLAAIIVGTGQPILAAGVLLAVTGAALGAICAQLDRSRWAAAVGVALIATNPLLVSACTVTDRLSDRSWFGEDLAE
jgi:hypothetical protein